MSVGLVYCHAATSTEREVDCCQCPSRPWRAVTEPSVWQHYTFRTLALLKYIIVVVVVVMSAVPRPMSHSSQPRNWD